MFQMRGSDMVLEEFDWIASWPMIAGGIRGAIQFLSS
jgi:hypothetical protein